MVPYPPPYAQAKTEENQVLRSLGAILALLGLLLAALGIIFHQNGAELVFALLIAILSLRVFILWLGDTQQNQKREPFTPPHPARRNSQSLTLPYPPQSAYSAHSAHSGYVVPPSFSPVGTNQMTVPTGFSAPPMQSFPPASAAPAPVPAPYAPARPMSPALLPAPGQTSAHWSYAQPSYPPGQPMPPAQNEQAASSGQWRQRPVQEEDWQE